MKNTIIAIILICAITLLSGCGCSLMDQKYNAETTPSVIAGEEISEEDKKAYTQAIDHANNLSTGVHFLF